MVTLTYPVFEASIAIWLKSNAVRLFPSRNRQCANPGHGLWLPKRTSYRSYLFLDEKWACRSRDVGRLQLELYQAADHRRPTVAFSDGSLAATICFDGE
jgi:hypothetical protein